MTEFPFLLASVVLLGIMFGFIMVVYEDGVSFGLFKRLRCKTGFHKFMNKIGTVKIRRFYCYHCKKPRRHPPLTIYGGGKRDKFKF